MGHDLMRMISQNQKIRHSNDLNATLSALPISAKRALFMALKNIPPHKDVDHSTIFKIEASSYAEAAGIDISEAYRQLKDGAGFLRESYFSLNPKDILNMRDYLRIPEEYKKSNKVIVNLISSVSYQNDDSTLILKFNPEILPLISKLKGDENKYTTQLLLSAMVLKSTYSYSIYQFLRKEYSSNKWKKSIEIDIDDLKKEILCYDITDDFISFKYPKFAIFKREVLDKSFKEIEEKTEIKNITLSNGKKQGRKLKTIIVTFDILEEESSDSDIDIDIDTEGVEEFVHFHTLNKTAQVGDKKIIDNKQANALLIKLNSSNGKQKPLSLIEASKYILETYFVVETVKKD